jgi:hypothetical protein
VHGGLLTIYCIQALPVNPSDRRQTIAPLPLNG